MKTINLAVLGALALLMSACGRSATYENTGVSDGYRVDFPGLGGYSLINVWRDPQTGCESYMTDDGFMSPRLNADGSQRCFPVRQ